MPRLVRFYGGSPLDWWARIPLGLIRPCVESLPGLMAEESFLEVERIALGSGTLKKDDSQRIVERWQNALTAGEDAPKGKTMSDQELASMGLGVRKVKLKP